jgi:aerobic carbon-monoxide dehydrogenase medium subunit
VLAPFKYFAPETLDQASALLIEHGPRARALAGGTALLVALERAQSSADAVINLKQIPGLKEISFGPAQGLRLGALVTLSELRRSEAVRTHYPVLNETIDFIATPQVRNLATVGGNLCAAAPAADLSVTLLALDARVRICSPRGGQVLALDSFFPTWGGTILAPGEILTQIEIPLPRGSAHYSRFMIRQAVDVPLANLAIAIEKQREMISNARIVLGANGARPTRMRRAERALEQYRLSTATIARAEELVAADSFPTDDLRASRTYRREVIGVMTRRILMALAAELDADQSR